ncbi:MAG: hypothetical protein JWN11_2607 [Hyphomicrobiales bacterium]|nr:hypothetical protein [Hyphomicrobiales bacterium]
MARGRLPRTDFGTVLLHWLIVAFLVVAMATGLRIASDVPGLGWLALFDSILPRENLWYWHLIGALGFTASFIAYITYILAARLGQRTRIDSTRLATLFRAGPPRWAAISVLLVWIVFGAFAVEIVSGILLYLGQAGWALLLHRNMLWICLAFPFLHIIVHFAHGGVGQVLRIFRPARLVVPPRRPDILALLAEYIQLVDDMRRGRAAHSARATGGEARTERNLHPLLLATCASIVVVAAGLTLERGTGMKLFVPSIGQLGQAEAPVLDGDISDAVWAGAPMVSVLSDEGASFGGNGQSRIDVKAVHDAEQVYFAFTWEDPTRSLKHLPLVKGETGWRLVRSQQEAAREEQFAEDKFSILLSRPTLPLLGAAIHLSPRPIPGYPASMTGRGLHYTKPNNIADVWIWRADHGGLVGYLEDARFGEALEPTPAQTSGQQRYAGGFEIDPGENCFPDNFEQPATLQADGALIPKRLPKDMDAMAIERGEVHESADLSEDERARWWLTTDETEPYSPEADRRIPTVTVIPSVLMTCMPSGDRADVQGMARWSAGRWTLETARRIDTKSVLDVPVVTGVMMWLAAFDHSATRHTRHIRPITLELQ